MKNLIKNVAYWAGVLVLGVALGVTIKIVGAWVEPDQMPPGGNIAAPLNTGNVGQTKLGGLILNTGGSVYGLIVDKGLVGIKTTTPQAELDVNGDIRAHNLNLNNNLNVGGNANINGNTTINGNLNVNGTITGTNTTSGGGFESGYILANQCSIENVIIENFLLSGCIPESKKLPQSTNWTSLIDDSGKKISITIPTPGLYEVYFQVDHYITACGYSTYPYLWRFNVDNKGYPISGHMGRYGASLDELAFSQVVQTVNTNTEVKVEYRGTGTCPETYLSGILLRYIQLKQN